MASAFALCSAASNVSRYRGQSKHNDLPALSAAAFPGSASAGAAGADAGSGAGAGAGVGAAGGLRGDGINKRFRKELL